MFNISVSISLLESGLIKRNSRTTLLTALIVTSSSPWYQLKPHRLVGKTYKARHGVDNVLSFRHADFLFLIIITIFLNSLQSRCFLLSSLNVMVIIQRNGSFELCNCSSRAYVIAIYILAGMQMTSKFYGTKITLWGQLEKSPTPIEGLKMIKCCRMLRYDRLQKPNSVVPYGINRAF